MRIVIDLSLRIRLLHALKVGIIDTFALPELFYDDEQISVFDGLIKNQNNGDKTNAKR